MLLKQTIVINKVITKVIAPYAFLANVSFSPHSHYLHYDQVNYIMFAFTLKLNTEQQIKNQLFISYSSSSSSTYIKSCKFHHHNFTIVNHIVANVT